MDTTLYAFDLGLPVEPEPIDLPVPRAPEEASAVSEAFSEAA